MKHQYICFDIECTALPDEILEAVKPEFSAPAQYKDAAKIREYIVAAEEKWKEAAALDAMTGQILCIGIKSDDGTQIISGTEPLILSQFFDFIANAKESQAGAVSFIGFNSDSFDLPYICRRSWLLGVKVPSWIRKGRYWHESFVDLRSIWQCGDRQAHTGGLNGLARAFGLPGKNGSGKDFGRLWIEDREKAIEYLNRDLELCWDIATRMGVIQ